MPTWAKILLAFFILGLAASYPLAFVIAATLTLIWGVLVAFGVAPLSLTARVLGERAPAWAPRWGDLALGGALAALAALGATADIAKPPPPEETKTAAPAPEKPAPSPSTARVEPVPEKKIDPPPVVAKVEPPPEPPPAPEPEPAEVAPTPAPAPEVKPEPPPAPKPVKVQLGGHRGNKGVATIPGPACADGRDGKEIAIKQIRIFRQPGPGGHYMMTHGERVQILEQLAADEVLWIKVDAGSGRVGWVMSSLLGACP